MANGFEKCPNCAAPLQGAADGRSVRCPYCGAGGARDVDPVQLATSLRAEWRSVEDLLAGLADRLAREFPDLTRVEKSGGFLARKRVESLELTADGSLFRMRRAPHGVVAERSEVVRGIAVKTETLPAGAWLEELARALSAMAASSARTYDALRRMTGA